ncbi:hypothetical protein BT93_L4831 [Corymbia citriodora subsp. variegata]|uniref:CENP-V/GFA domain-containing protein n=1 Tax=Corymbia citriodora subsp. variegata TaxID=360336 RepID=A0A8T0CKB5_CORYI|nr:hypothetical protein BT93_L4831 [Corymbia citriodora subsp. variegata]
MSSYEGSCHCGETQWTVKLNEDQAKHILCHCMTCQSLSGGAYTLNQIVPKDAISFSKGGNSLKSYTYKGDSGKDVHCYYCPNCTTHPYHNQTANEGNIVVRTGLLKKAHSIEPAAEIFGKDRFSFQKETAHTFEVLPPQ